MSFRLAEKIISQLNELPLFGIDIQDPWMRELPLNQETLNELTQHLISITFLSGVGKDHVRLIKDGNDLHPASFYDSRIGSGLIEHTHLKDQIVSHVLSNNGTLVVDHVNDLSPVAQLIKEYVEAKTDGYCWIQCYVTKSTTSAFSMHSDDHPFLILQLTGMKNWSHATETKGLSRSIMYKPGTIAFYPRGYKHNVSGIGEYSVHLTIAFDSRAEFETSTVNNLRRGTGLPYSLGIPVSTNTRSRLAMRWREWKVSEGKVHIRIGERRIRFNSDFEGILALMFERTWTTPSQVAAELGIDINRVLAFWQQGYQSGLLFNALHEGGTR